MFDLCVPAFCLADSCSALEASVSHSFTFFSIQILSSGFDFLKLISLCTLSVFQFLILCGNLFVVSLVVHAFFFITLKSYTYMMVEAFI